MSVARCFLILCGWLPTMGPALAAAESPLAAAAERQDLAAVRMLLAEGADVNAAQPDGMTALHWAAFHDDLQLVQTLVTAGGRVTVRTRYDVTPLSLACTNGSTAIVELLLEKGADPNSTLPGGETALMTASRTGRLGPVKALLSRGADVNARERKGQTALMWAAAEGHLEVVSALLEAGANRDERLRSGFTPLFFAAREGRTVVVRRLLEAGADVNQTLEPQSGSGPNSRKGASPLLMALENGHFETAQALLEAGANPNDKSAGFAPLHAVSWVRKPIRGDGDPPPIGSGRLTSLEAVRLLVQHGADVNLRQEKGDSGRGRFTTTGSTPFLLAARACDVPLMRLLVELGADPALPNADHSTPLLAAAGVGALGDGDEAAGTEAQSVAAAKLLLELGADVNAVDDNGETAMHGAAYQSRSALVRFLAGNGADVNVWNRRNKWGWTPLLIAEGHRPGNFRPAPATITAIVEEMRAKGVEPPAAAPSAPQKTDY
jgi:ankyrin repeat protein